MDKEEGKQLTNKNARKIKRTRCSNCRKKLSLGSQIKCRCEKIFCGSCRYPNSHQCPFDYKTSARERLALVNPGVVAVKVNKI